MRFLLLAVCVLVSASARAEPPNVILILLDDAGYGDFSCYGGKLPTPNIDRMRAEGMKFTQHYAGSTVCAPARCVLLTAKHTGRCRVRGNGEGLMQPEDVTIADVLKQAGYRTECIGKWGVGNPPPLDDPARNGFDDFYGYVSMWHAHNFYPEFLVRNGRREPLRNVADGRWQGEDGRGVAVKRIDYVPELLTREVLKSLETPRNEPFFLYYALNVPHANNEAGRFSERPEKGMEVPGFGPYESERWPAPERGFAAIMRNIDRDVGRILDKVKELGLGENTLVLLTSDNGPHQEGGHQMEFFNSNGGLRGMKRDLYEGGIRVPLLAWWPGRIAAGAQSDLICGFQDFLPTLAELAGADVPEEVDGISILTTLLGAQERQPQHDFLYWEFMEQKGKRALRQGNWKIVQTDVSTDHPGDPELYHLGRDLGEEQNVAAEHPDVVRRLTRLMDGAHEPSPLYPLFPSERNVRQ